MSAKDNAATVRAINDAFNDRDWDYAMSKAADDAEWVNVPTGQTFRGPEGVRQFLEGWATAFPDSRVETTNVIADEHGAVLEFVGRGTQTGTLRGPLGDLPPTGRHVETPFVQVVQFRDGKITRARLYFDLAGMMQQLGVGAAGSEAPAVS